MAHTLQPTHVEMMPNGLRVLIRQQRHVPLACLMVWYGVGGRNAAPGQTGISHFLEHMMFKGTERFPYGMLDEAIKRRGGIWNAFTSQDYTAYYELLPARHLEFALELESDRMAGMTFDPDLTIRERGIIVSERSGRENHPYMWLMDAFMSEAYHIFPYRHSVLGSKEDIQAITAEALLTHYQRYYRPNNATLVVVGDCETDWLLDRVAHHFGHISPGPAVPPLTEVEPEQTEERRCHVRRPGPNPYLLMGYKAPPADHPDQVALLLLSAVLSGAPSMGATGGSVGRASRFYRRLVNSGLATAASAFSWTFAYSGLFCCNAVPLPDVSLDRLEEAVIAEVDLLRHELVSDEEIERAQKQVRAQFLYALESTAAHARLLGITAMVKGVEQFDSTLDLVDAVTPADLLRVAQRYLVSGRRTVARFIPEEPSAFFGAVEAPEQVEEAALSAATPSYQRPGQTWHDQLASGTRLQAFDPGRVLRRELPNGAALLVYPTAIASVFVRVQMEAGAVYDPQDQAGQAQLTAQMLPRGTERYTADQFALQADALGLFIRTESSRETASVTLKCLPEDLKAGLDLLAEVLLRPVFPTDELERMRERFLVSIKEEQSDTRVRAGRRLAELLYPVGHPSRHAIDGTEESLQRFTQADLRSFHAQRFRPAGAIITVVGAVDVARVEQMIRAILADWRGGAGRPVIAAVQAPQASRHHVSVAGKTQTDIALGWPLVSREHPDHLALDLLAIVMGGNGIPIQNRLYHDVRERYGLSYYQFANYHAALAPATWSLHMGVVPTRVEFAIDVLVEQLKRLRQQPIEHDELEALHRFLDDFPAVQLEAPERLAIKLAEIERFQLGLDYLMRYPEMVRALSPQDLCEVAARHLQSERLTVVTAGPDPAG